jgi:hypothetical protein
MDLIVPGDIDKVTDPMSFIFLLINEYAEDCASILEIENLPDEKEFKENKDRIEQEIKREANE